MSIDITYTATRITTVDAMPGATFDFNGAFVKRVDNSGKVAYQPLEGTTNEVLGGVAILDSRKLKYAPMVERVTIPSGSPYTITLKQKAVTGEYMVRAVSDASTITPASYTAATKTLTFDSADASKEVDIVYLWEPTGAAQINAAHMGAPVNADILTGQGKITLLSGTGEIATGAFDSTNWTVTTTVYSKSGGRVTGTSSSNTNLTSGFNVRVTAIPGVNDPYLHLEFSI